MIITGPTSSEEGSLDNQKIFTKTKTQTQNNKSNERLMYHKVSSQKMKNEHASNQEARSKKIRLLLILLNVNSCAHSKMKTERRTERSDYTTTQFYRLRF